MLLLDILNSTAPADKSGRNEDGSAEDRALTQNQARMLSHKPTVKYAHRSSVRKTGS